MCDCYDQGMVEQNRSLESDMIMLVCTFHHADVVWLTQGNEYVIMDPTIFVFTFSAIVPGEAYCHHEPEG